MNNDHMMVDELVHGRRYLCQRLAHRVSNVTHRDSIRRSFGPIEMEHGGFNQIVENLAGQFREVG